MRADKVFHYFGYVVLALIVLYSGAVLFLPRDYAVKLPRGYQLISIHSGGNAIANSGSWIMVGENVDRYGVVEQLVVGHVSPEKPFPRPEPESPGYFIVDTKTRKIQKGLTESQWLAALKTYGIDNMPDLSRPNWFHQFRRYR